MFEDYPRVCGGTVSLPVVGSAARGLSPRVRGNLTEGNAGYMDVRTIPACAGEPRAFNRLTLSSADYPRVCGGTSQDVAGLAANNCYVECVACRHYSGVGA